MWGGQPFGVQNKKSNFKNAHQTNRTIYCVVRTPQEAQDGQDAVLRFLKFSVSVALTRRLRFLRFSVHYAIYKIKIWRARFWSHLRLGMALSKRKVVARGNPIFGTVEPCKLLETRSSWSPKSQCVYGPNEITPVTFFVKTSTALTNRSAFASPTEWQDLGEPVADSRSPAPPACCPSLSNFFPSNARWLSPGRLSSRKNKCILQIYRINAVATSVITTTHLCQSTILFGIVWVLLSQTFAA